MSVLDEFLLGDPARRMTFGFALFVSAVAVLIWVESRVRRRGETYLDHREAAAFGVSVAPIGTAVMMSAPWGLMGAVVFVAVAIVVCGLGVLVMLLRDPF